MVTVVNNPNPVDRPTLIETQDSSAGWAVAVIILLAVIVVGAYFWMRHYRAPAAPAAPASGATVNVTLPAGNSSGNTSGSSASNAPAPANQ